MKTRNIIYITGFGAFALFIIGVGFKIFANSEGAGTFWRDSSASMDLSEYDFNPSDYDERNNSSISDNSDIKSDNSNMIRRNTIGGKTIKHKKITGKKRGKIRKNTRKLKK